MKMLESTIFKAPRFETLVSEQDEESFCPKRVTHECILGSLNHRLALSQRLSVAAVKKLIALHNHLQNDIYPFARKLSPKNDGMALQHVGRYVQNVEFAMQELWGFTQESSFHTHWCNIPHCICNKNGPNPYFLESWGKHTIRDKNCPVHGVNSEAAPHSEDQ
ncbi:hypothetical protein [Alteromonas macleodii]|uniref:hypothetical protein n=1 Tax=Alteromonas macleodii TaxID=28108 RepID=UPI003140C82F|tara:strand:- start:217763 stop:218251 length:489 start_codon:yes stop_codon:yes gene_type:complete